jgi:hypothetical protein
MSRMASEHLEDNCSMFREQQVTPWSCLRRLSKVLVSVDSGLALESHVEFYPSVIVPIVYANAKCLSIWSQPHQSLSVARNHSHMPGTLRIFHLQAPAVGSPANDFSKARPYLSLVADCDTVLSTCTSHVTLDTNHKICNDVWLNENGATKSVLNLP